MRDIKFYIILALVIALVISILTRPTKEITDIKPFQIQISEQNLIIDSLTRGRTKLARKIVEDSILQAEERHTFQNAIGSLQTRLRQRRDKIDTLILESPSLREYVATADSVIAFQSARIDSLESDKAELRVDVREITANFEAQLEAMRSKLKSTEEIAGVYKKEARRAKRGNRWLKAAIPVVGVGMFLLDGL